MSQSAEKKDRQAIAWLDQVSREVEADPDVLKALPIEEVRAELQDLGADVEGFHAKLSKTLRSAKLKQAGRALITWLSPCWQPQWAGQFVGAGDIPEQTHTFRLEQGAIEVACSWKPRSGNTPAYLDFSWKADMMMEGELWCRFVHTDTDLVLGEVPLGQSKEGGKYFTAQTLGFEPSQEKWAIVILMKQQGS